MKEKKDARRGRHARDPGRQSGRHPARRRRCPVAGVRGPQAQGTCSHDEEAGYNIVIRACRAPIKQIVENAGENGEVVANKVLENKTSNYGYDARHGPLLRHGQGRHHRPDQGGALARCKTPPASRTLLLTSDALVAEMPKEEKKPPAGRRTKTCTDRQNL